MRTRSSPDAACAVITPARTAATIVMAAKSEADKLKQKRRKAARTLLARSGQSGGSSVSNRPRKYLVDGKLVSKLPFNANGGTETAGLFLNNKYEGIITLTTTVLFTAGVEN